jgi:hypothetical protein
LHGGRAGVYFGSREINVSLQNRSEKNTRDLPAANPEYRPLNMGCKGRRFALAWGD